MEEGQFLSLREAYISSLIQSLEPFKKFLGGWGVLKPILVISPRPRPKSRLINGQKIYHYHITGEEVCRV